MDFLATRMKCLCCKEIFIPDRRNFGRQKYCSKEPCQLESKRQSQRRWLAKPENQNHFRGSENCERVRQWRKANPGYWRRRKKKSSSALQDSCPPQAPDNQGVNGPGLSSLSLRTLQDVCQVQVPLLVGLAASLLGPALQEDMVAHIRRLVARGVDFLDMPSREKFVKPNQHYDQEKTPAARPVAASPAAL